jgi:hypothetical protein
MKATLPFVVALLLSCGLAACSQEEGRVRPSSSPVSIRGYIQEIETADPALYRLRSATTGASEARMEIFRQTSVVVDEFEFASGGVAEYGAFMVLDAPPGTATLTFTAPHVNDVKVRMTNVPENADIFLPGLILTTKGASIADPSKVVVRVPKDGDDEAPGPVTIAGVQIPVRVAPLSELGNRREWPSPIPLR